MIGIASFVVEYGRAQSIKEEMQSAADATAISVMGAYADGGMGAANAACITYSQANSVDKGSGIAPTYAFVGGTWNPSTHVFTVNGSVGLAAVRVTVSRTLAGRNPVALPLGSVIGRSTCDVSATAIAALIDSVTTSATVPSTANTYFAGMPNGWSNSWGDTTTNAKPCNVTAFSVVPGTYITVTSATGTTSICPGTTPFVSADGESTRPLHHGQNQDGADWNIGPENGIADAIIPACALTGIFLDNNQPNSTATPSTCVDWTAAGQKDRAVYSDLALKTPFKIGDGKTTGGVVQQFMVPPGATRLYLSIWDGVTSSNNSGSLTVTTNLKRQVRLVN